MIADLNKYGFCLEPKMKYNVLNEIGNHFLDRAAELVKAGYRFVYVLDNIDWEEKAHDMRQDVQNRSVHYQKYGTRWRRTCAHCPNMATKFYYKLCRN